MKVLGFREVAITDLVLPDNFEVMTPENEVSARADSIRQIGVIHEPVVRSVNDWLFLLAGRQRIAALKALGHENALVKVVECSDAEAIEVEYQENVARRHDPEFQRAQLLERLQRLADEAAATTPEPSVPRPPGRPQSAKGKAREIVASERGLKPETVRQAEYREKKRKAKLGEVTTDTKGFATLGFTLGEEFIAQAKGAQAYLKDAASKVRSAQLALTSLSNSNFGYPVGRLNSLREGLKSFAAAIEGGMPTGLCPYCKAIDGVQQRCTCCEGGGYIVRDQHAGVPSELWREESPLVVVDGHMELVNELLGDFENEPEQDPEEDDPWPFQ